MAGLPIEGDVSQISDQQLKYIKSVIEKRGYTDNKVIIEAIGQVGDNYIANVKRIIVEDEKGNTFKMVAKVAPTHEIMRKMANSESLFRNEDIMYTKILPKFTELEIAANVPVENKLKYAACYGSSSDVPNEVILLEDLKVSDFIMLDRFKPMSPDCVKSVLRNFAILHSLSYALKYKEPEFFDEYKHSFFDIWAFTHTKEEVNVYFKHIENQYSKIVDSDVHKKAINGAILRSLKAINELAEYEKDEKYSIIQQGDAWTNNIMFKFDGDTLLESIMIDYQISKPTSPVADILYLILNCTDYEMRKENFHDWIDYYHSELDKSLSNYDLKANFVFPKDQLDADLKKYGKLSFGLSILLASVLTANTEEATQMKKAMETEDAQVLLQEENAASIDLERRAILKEKLEGLVESCLELGLI